MTHFVVGSYASSSATECRTTTTVAAVKKEYPAQAGKLAHLADSATVDLVVKRASFEARREGGAHSGSRSAAGEAVWVEDAEGAQVALIENDSAGLVGSYPHSAQIKSAFADIGGAPKTIDQGPAKPL